MLACVGAALSRSAEEGEPIPDETVPARSGGEHGLRAWLAVACAHLASTLWLFGGVATGKVLYFRDLSTYFAPQFAFAHSALRAGVWPLWNPLVNTGEPFLLVYPVDLVLVWVGGALAPLGVGAALHLLWALLGGSVLARTLGLGPVPAFLVGAVYGLGGFCLATVNLLPLFQAAAWAPWVLAALVAADQEPRPRRFAILAVVAAVQATTLGGEIVIQTGLVGLVLVGGRRLALDRRRLAGFAAALGLSLLLAAPAILGVRALVQGTARSQGFSSSEVLAYSVHPVAAAEMVLPRFLGDPQAFTDRDFWGRAYSPTGFPYLITVYLGLPALVVASLARGRRRLVVLAVVGLLLALGRYGPLALLPDSLSLPFRAPPKLLFMAHVAVALLAGFGLQRGVETPPSRARLLLAVPGALLLGAGLVLLAWPEAVHQALAWMAPPLGDSRGLVAAREVWPSLWVPSGVLALAAGLALARGRSLAWAATLLVALDLLIVNGATNRLTPSSFYELRPDVAALIQKADDDLRRWFSYGVARTPGLAFEASMAGAPSDVWLYYLDRQSLLPRTPALDGLEGALDVDRTGWSRPGATLTHEEATPERFREHHDRLRQAGVGWALSFRPLPEDLVVQRGEVKLPEIVSPLRLYELRRPLRRAYWVPGRGGGGGPGRDGRVDYRRLDPHTVLVKASTPPGLLVVLDGHHPDWAAEDRSGPIRLQEGPGGSLVVPTAGGDREITLRFRPGWPRLAFILAGLGFLGVIALARR